MLCVGRVKCMCKCLIVHACYCAWGAHIHAGMYRGLRLITGVFIAVHIIYLLIYLEIERLSVCSMCGDLSLWAILLFVSTLSFETESLPDPRAYQISVYDTCIVPSLPPELCKTTYVCSPVPSYLCGYLHFNSNHHAWAASFLHTKPSS